MYAPNELLAEVQERTLELVVALGRDLVVLQVLLAVEGDLLGLDLAVLDVDLVAAQHDRDALAHAHEVLVPAGDVLVGDARRDVEHDDGAVALDVVTIAEAAELLLAGSVPHVEAHLTGVGVEAKRVHLDTDGGWRKETRKQQGKEISRSATRKERESKEREQRTSRERARESRSHTNVLLLELASQMALDEGGLADTTVADEDQLEGERRLRLEQQHVTNHRPRNTTTAKKARQTRCAR